MIFRPELAERVMRGQKTVTRRLPSKNPRSPWYRGGCKLRPGRPYSVQPGRNKAAVGRVRIQSVRLEQLGWPSEEEVRREGFYDEAAFAAYWRLLHGRYNPRQWVWRVEFERVDQGWGGLERPPSALGWELRGHMAAHREIRVTLDERCDGVYPNRDGDRILQGKISSVSPTDAFCIMAGRHIPLEAILAVKLPHHTDRPASSQADPLDATTAARAASIAA